MDLGLDGKVAVVLAASTGLGFASARALLREGAAVAISGRDAGSLARAHDELARSAPERVLSDSLDVTDGVALRAHLAEVRARFGRIDVLVTNAGGPPAGSAAEVEDDALERAFELTLKSAVRAVREVLPGMRAAGWGRVIALTSLSVRQPIAHLALSNSMRAGLTGWLKTLADEVAGQGVTVNSVCTGLFDTDRLQALFDGRAARSGRTPDEERAAAVAGIPAGRLGSPEEFGDLVAFLASERSGYLTGLALPIDGGLLRAVF